MPSGRAGVQGRRCVRRERGPARRGARAAGSAPAPRTVLIVAAAMSRMSVGSLSASHRMLRKLLGGTSRNVLGPKASRLRSTFSAARPSFKSVLSSWATEPQPPSARQPAESLSALTSLSFALSIVKSAMAAAPARGSSQAVCRRARARDAVRTDQPRLATLNCCLCRVVFDIRVARATCTDGGRHSDASREGVLLARAHTASAPRTHGARRQRTRIRERRERRRLASSRLRAVRDLIAARFSDPCSH